MADVDQTMAYAIASRLGHLANSDAALNLLCPNMRSVVRQLAGAMGHGSAMTLSSCDDVGRIEDDIAHAMGVLMRSEEVRRCFTPEGLRVILVHSVNHGYVQKREGAGKAS